MNWAILGPLEFASGERQGIKLVGVLHLEKDESCGWPGQDHAWNMASRAGNMVRKGRENEKH